MFTSPDLPGSCVSSRCGRSKTRIVKTMTPEFPQKRSGRKRRKPLKIDDENASDEDEQVTPLSSSSSISSTQPTAATAAAALLQPMIEEKMIKKKRGRKPGQGHHSFHSFQ